MRVFTCVRAVGLAAVLVAGLAAGGLITAGSARAQEAPSTEAPAEEAHPIDIELGQCIERDPSTAGMMDCFGHAAQAWDQELNAAYTALAEALTGEDRTRLRDAQRAWLAFRDRENDLMETLRGQLEGTMWGPMLFEQQVDVIKRRALQLRTYMTFLEEGRP